MTQQIPGVPEGWELISIDRINDAEWTVDDFGNPTQWRGEPSTCVYPIIRKIDRPAKYRPFANAEEYLPHWGKPIRLKDGVGFDSVVSTSRIGIYVANETLITRYSLSDAFKRLEFADGTPFGVRTDE